MSVLTIADHYDAELRRHNEHLRAATAIGPTDRVLDIGCGAGQTTREAARAASSGSVLGVDVSEQMLERARRLTQEAGLQNITYELGDAQIHPFQPAYFDVLISRFGTMFFTEPVAAFANLAHASRRGARLVMMVWQNCERNEWATDIPAALAAPDHNVSFNWGQGLFSLAEPVVVEPILQKAGFCDIGFTESPRACVLRAGCGHRVPDRLQLQEYERDAGQARCRRGGTRTRSTPQDAGRPSHQSRGVFRLARLDRHRPSRLKSSG